MTLLKDTYRLLFQSSHTAPERNMINATSFYERDKKVLRITEAMKTPQQSLLKTMERSCNQHKWWEVLKFSHLSFYN